MPRKRRMLNETPEAEARRTERWEFYRMQGCAAMAESSLLAISQQKHFPEHICERAKMIRDLIRDLKFDIMALPFPLDPPRPSTEEILAKIMGDEKKPS